jgi:hypothetical protein
MNMENLAGRYTSPVIKGLLAIASSLNPIIAVPSAKKFLYPLRSPNFSLRKGYKKIPKLFWSLS